MVLFRTQINADREDRESGGDRETRRQGDGEKGRKGEGVKKK